ncbi:MAG: hypothetical protein JWP87_6341, partial [Labilithrix sp.]|nr:hypothetical protein [Labilithrix sp.]
MRSANAGVIATAAAIVAAIVAVAASSVGVACSSYKPDLGDTAAADAAPEPPAGDAGADTSIDASACGKDLETDPKNCGRCGHDCLGGVCTGGKCGAVFLGTAPKAPFSDVLVTSTHVYASTTVELTTESGGIWRVSKSGGDIELFAAMRDARGMTVVGDKLYFVVEAGSSQPGLYACPLAGTTPCTPKLIAAAQSPHAIASDRGRVFYPDGTAGQGLMVYDTASGAAPTLFRSGQGIFASPGNVFVDGDISYTTTQAFTFPQRGSVIEVLANDTLVDVYSYASTTANDGRLFVTSDSLYYTAYDFGQPGGGVVRRMSRGGVGGCDLGGSGNARP